MIAATPTGNIHTNLPALARSRLSPFVSLFNSPTTLISGPYFAAAKNSAPQPLYPILGYFARTTTEWPFLCGSRPFMPKTIYSARHDELRALLATARRQSGLTQVQLADILNRPQSFVSKYEGGERRLDVIEFIDVCKAIKIDPLDVIKLLHD